jgi:hypothetical protein
LPRSHDAGQSAIDNGAPRARTISAAFLADFNEHFAGEGHGIFSKIYNDAPIEYWSGLIALAKVTKIEMGTPGDFDRPATEDEALDRLERTEGPHARPMLEQFLKQVKKLEAKYLEEESTD